MPDPISWTDAGPWYLAALLGGYLLGSIPFGLLFTRMAGLGDIRDIGSGNIGATNALRTGNKAVAFGTLIFDALKGGIALYVAGELGGPDLAVLAAIGALLGHCYPIWLKFRGGKGVSTFLGILWFTAWPIAILTCLTWLLMAALFRISSLSALVAAALTPVYFYMAGAWKEGLTAWMQDLYSANDWQWAQATLVLVIVIYIRHQENIGRLLRGEEPKIGAKKDEA